MSRMSEAPLQQAAQHDVLLLLLPAESREFHFEAVSRSTFQIHTFITNVISEQSPITIVSCYSLIGLHSRCNTKQLFIKH